MAVDSCERDPGNRISSAWTLGKFSPSAFSGPYEYGILSSLFADNDTTCSQCFEYVILSGTCGAAPMVSGAAALLVQKFGPTITPDAIKAKLMKSASKAFPANSMFGTQAIQNDMFTIGAGYPDVMAALNNTDTAPAGKFAVSRSRTYTCGAAGGGRCVAVRHDANSLFTTTSSPALCRNQAVGVVRSFGGTARFGATAAGSSQCPSSNSATGNRRRREGR